MTFSALERVRFRHFMGVVFRDFLKKCYGEYLLQPMKSFSSNMMSILQMWRSARPVLSVRQKGLSPLHQMQTSRRWE